MLLPMRWRWAISPARIRRAGRSSSWVKTPGATARRFRPTADSFASICACRWSSRVRRSKLKDWIDLSFKLSQSAGLYIGYICTVAQADGGGSVNCRPNQFPVAQHQAEIYDGYAADRSEQGPAPAANVETGIAFPRAIRGDDASGARSGHQSNHSRLRGEYGAAPRSAGIHRHRHGRAVSGACAVRSGTMRACFRFCRWA